MPYRITFTNGKMFVEIVACNAAESPNCVFTNSRSTFYYSQMTYFESKALPNQTERFTNDRRVYCHSQNFSLRWRLHHANQITNSRHTSLENEPPEAIFLDWTPEMQFFLNEINGNGPPEAKFFEILTPEMQFSLRKSMDLE